jgi:hypothetical protein
MRACRFAAIAPLLILAFTTSVASQQLSAQSTASIILFNTGFQDDGTLVPDGERDPHYMLIASADPRFPGPNAYTLSDPAAYPFPNWLPNTSISKWITPESIWFNNAQGNYIYRTTFSLPNSFNPQKDTASITGRWSTDNTGLDILINGLSTGNTIPYGNPCGLGGYSYYHLCPLSITTGFQQGLNILDFVVYNEGDITGLHVQMTGTYTMQDADSDGVPDDADECPSSILTLTVVIGGCDSGVTNTLFPSGCSISDDINLCAAGAKNHGEFVSCVAHYLNDLKKAGILTGKQKGAIQECAGKARIP